LNLLQGSVLVVDDLDDNRRLMRLMLEKAGFTVFLAESGKQALELYREHRIDLALVDLQMPEMDGIQVLQRLREIDPAAQVIVITAYGSIEKAVAAMKAGAIDFVTRPVRREVLLALVEKGINVGELVAENTRLRDEVGSKYDFSSVAANSPSMQQVVALALEAAKRDTTVLITGESGVGKEVLARAIHFNSARKNGPFFALNCAAITESLMDSELFGYERGAFTGADRRKAGLLEQASRGTLLLDEIGDMPLAAQAKLLRVIENREMIPVGGTKAVRVEARLIAATNAELRQRVQAKQFREDLFFRLNVLAIPIPPLRERREDILPLARSLLARLARETGKDLPGFSQDAVDYLMTSAWEGNVRELANAIERAVIVSRGNLLTAQDFPPRSPAASIPAALPLSLEAIETDGMKLEDVERTLLVRALERANHNLTGAARLLGMGRGALRYRLEKYGISPKDGAN
jgi:DNA-binding NtrC family response regulator